MQQRLRYPDFQSIFKQQEKQISDLEQLHMNSIQRHTWIRMHSVCTHRAKDLLYESTDKAAEQGYCEEVEFLVSLSVCNNDSVAVVLIEFTVSILWAYWYFCNN